MSKIDFLKEKGISFQICLLTFKKGFLNFFDYCASKNREKKLYFGRIILEKDKIEKAPFFKKNAHSTVV